MIRSKMQAGRTRRAIAASAQAALLLATASLVVSSPPTASADAIATAQTKAVSDVQNGPMLISGPGGVGATSLVGPLKTVTQDPAAGAGDKFDDTVKIGPMGKQVDVLSTKQTDQIGGVARTTYPGLGNNNVIAGETLRYNTMTSNDKVNDATKAMNKTSTMQVNSGPILGPAKITTTSATAIQTTFLNANGTGQAIGLASANVTHNIPKPNPMNIKPEASLSVAAINDPLHFNFTSLSQSVTASIGGGFLLQATSPGDFARAYFEVGTDKLTSGTDQTLAAFSIGIDSTTKSLAGVNVEFSAFSSQIGFADQGTFTSYLESFLNFNASTDTLSVANPSSDILLYTLSVSQPTADVELTFNSDAIVGSTVPEPASLVMLGLGLLGAAWVARRRERTPTAPGSC